MPARVSNSNMPKSANADNGEDSGRGGSSETPSANTPEMNHSSIPPINNGMTADVQMDEIVYGTPCCTLKKTFGLIVKL